ncbi:Eco57I restriction-modification methylase domain-containing protein [Micrococcus luteus]|nr:Eco57I restriction-modification methylase domain-containing protein [Micrococcus luteus]
MVEKRPPDVHVPDVLETLAQLPNDDVYTPPKVAAAMLDILPMHVWSEPHYTWLDPATKSGVYLREVFKRLMVGLAKWEPNGAMRREHILRNMLFGAATTQINGEVARRSLYQTKNATGVEVKDESLRDLIVSFDQPAGNVPFVETGHTFRGEGANRRCSWCGAPEALVRESREQYAYSFIHHLYPTAELEHMKFDVIVGNPPYQIGVEGNTRTRPLYQLFVERAIALNPRYIVMITPSRWFTGGLGLDEYRDRMINDRRLKVIVDHPKIFDVFPQAKIRGGVSYFLWDRDYGGDCAFSTRIDGRIISTATRDIREGHGVLIRDNTASALVHQVLEHTEHSVEELFYPRLAFSQEWRTNFRGDSEQPIAGGIPIIHNGGVGYVREQSFERNRDVADMWKVLLPKASSGDTAQDSQGRIIDVVLGEPIAVAPGSVCTESYFVAGAFETRDETENYAHYLATKFVRFLVLQRKATQDITADRFRFAPALDFTRAWSDEDLYAHFNLTQDHIDYIESSIKPRSVNLSLDSAIPDTHLPGGRKHRAVDAPAESDDEDGEDE